MISTQILINAERNVSDRFIGSMRPYISQVAGAIRSGFDLSSALEIAGKAHENLSRNFVTNGDPSSFGLSPEFLFPERNRIQNFTFMNPVTRQAVKINALTIEEVREIANILLRIATAGVRSDFATGSPGLDQAFMRLRIHAGHVPQTGWRIAPACGIVRLQHASFLIQTSKARVLVDPHFVSGYSSGLQDGSLMLPHNFNSVDAVLITHSHSDHYHVPSLMMIPRDRLIIVPKVPCESILSPSFAEDLRSIGFQNVIDPEWYSEPVIVEDIEIRTLPFFGEQPLRYEDPRDKRLRNWGNSYLFRTPDFSAWCLIDSGSDAEGSMLEVAQVVKEQFGNVDAVLSNLQRFYVGVGQGNPFYITGRGQYWLSLTGDQVVRFPSMSNDLITLGAEGVAEICALVRAKTFLPYSHLWSEIGTAPGNEPRMLEALAREESFITSDCKIQNWRIGDLWQPGPKGFSC